MHNVPPGDLNLWFVLAPWLSGGIKIFYRQLRGAKRFQLCVRIPAGGREYEKGSQAQSFAHPSRTSSDHRCP